MKLVHFVGSSREDRRDLPQSVEETAEFQLFKIPFLTGPRCGNHCASGSARTAIRHGPVEGHEAIAHGCESSIGEHVMIKNGMRPVHPREILSEEFMKPSDPPIYANMLAKALQVPANRITAIIKGQRASA